MPITPAPTDIFYNLQIKPDYLAGTLAELDSALATYAEKYVLVAETGKIYFVQTSEGSYQRLEAYDFNNYRHSVDAGSGGTGGSGVLFGESDPIAASSEGDVYLKIHENRWFKFTSGVWVDQSSVLLAIQPNDPGLTSSQRGLYLKTLEYSDPTIVQPYISLGSGSAVPGSGNETVIGDSLYYPTDLTSIDPGTPVKVDSSGKLVLASSNDLSLDNVLGVTTGTQTGSGLWQVQIYGFLQINSWFWTIGAPVFVGLAGTLTQTPHSSGVVLEIGYALSEISINIRIQAPIYL